MHKFRFNYLFILFSIILVILILNIQGNSIQTHKILKTEIILRIDDYGIDNNEFYDKILPIIKRTKCKLTIGVVPYKKVDNRIIEINDTLLKKLKLYIVDNQYIEIALHGFTHENLLNHPDASEFYKQGYDKQSEKIELGKALLEEKLGVQVTTFIPPWNSYDFNTTNVLVSKGFKCISAASYGMIDFKNQNPNLMYIPYSIELTDFIFKNINEISNYKEGVSIVLFHAYDFVEGQTDNKNNEYYKKRATVSLKDFERFIIKLQNNPNIQFCTFKEICNNEEIDFSVQRYNHSFISTTLQTYWPQLSKESVLYLSRDKMNYKNIYSLIYPFIFYLFFIIISYYLTLQLFSKINIKRKHTLLILNISFLLFSILQILFLKSSLKFLVFYSVWLGILCGYFTVYLKNIKKKHL
ncbi:MAG: DUF2334 domain-containing protein [Bacteroidota bacterium]